MIKIIPAKENHIPIIQRISHQTWPIAFKGILSPEQITYMLKMMYSTESLKEQMEKGHIFILAKEKDNFVGFASFEPGCTNLPKTKIHKLYILPSAQGKGVGKKFIQELNASAEAKGDYLLSLNVNKYNSSAIRFYEKNGFKETAREDISIGNGFWMEDVVMERKVEGTAKEGPIATSS
jgi:diamine N-acetyltransferase